MPETAKEFQNRLTPLLSEYFATFNGTPVRKEWRAFEDVTPSQYSPRTDIAVGPFATGELRLEPAYDELARRSREKLQFLLRCFRENIRGRGLAAPNNLTALNHYNPNARCFIAIEIEKSGSMKHRLGDIVNATALGRVGIIVPMETGIMESFFRITRYFDMLGLVGKPTFSTRNLLIVTKEQILSTFQTRDG